MKGSSESTLFKHAQGLYGHMLLKSEPQLINEDEYTVYRGFLTHEFNELNIPIAYYTPIKSKMEEYGCWTIIQAGARTVPSIVVLHKPPSQIVGWDSKPAAKKDLTGAAQYAMLRAEVDGLVKALGGINLAEALRNLEERITALEKSSTQV